MLRRQGEVAKDMDKRTTIYDIAARLGVSTATVNRALTGKPRVKDETRKLVLQAAEEMGFRPNLLARSLGRRRLRFAAVGFTSFPEFHTAFLKGVQDEGSALADFNISVDCYNFDQGSSDSEKAQKYLNDTLRHIADDGYDGVLVLGRMAEAFEYLHERKICVATVVNDIEDRGLRRFTVCYRGRIAGRMAAELIYRMMADKRRPVAIASGFETTVVHSETEKGFREQLIHTPLDLAEVIYNHDNTGMAYESTKRLLESIPGLGAIYINSFNYTGVIRAVYDSGRAGDLLIVSSDISGDLKRLISEGTVVASIFQNQYEQGRLGLRRMYDLLANGTDVDDVNEIDPQIIMGSNLSLF